MGRTKSTTRLRTKSSSSKTPPSLFIGADHRGFKTKENIKTFLIKKEISFKDCGNTKHQNTDDYPDFAKAVAKNIQTTLRKKNPSKGILLCGSAQGMVIVANKFKGIRAASARTKDELKYLIEDDHINVLCIPGESKTSKPISKKSIQEMINIFLTTKPKQTKRHERRIKKIKKIESNNFKK